MVAFLPAPLAYGLALLEGDLRYSLQGYTRKGVMDCLELVFGPKLSTQKRDRIARDFFRMRSCEMIDGMRLLGRGDALLRLVEVRGLEHLTAALVRGKGAIICGAHIGSPKSCFSLVGALGFPITVIARWSYSKHGSGRSIRRLFHLLKSSMPVTSHLSRPNIERKPGNVGIAFQAAVVLRQNELVGIMLDHAVRPTDPSRPVLVDFLNGKASLVPGAITVAQLTGAPVLVMLMHRLADWRHQILEISPPIPIEGEAMIAFRRCLALVETAIRRYPAQWERLPQWKRLHAGL